MANKQQKQAIEELENVGYEILTPAQSRRLSQDLNTINTLASEARNDVPQEARGARKSLDRILTTVSRHVGE